MDRSEKYVGSENDLILHRHLKFSKNLETFFFCRDDLHKSSFLDGMHLKCPGMHSRKTLRVLGCNSQMTQFGNFRKVGLCFLGAGWGAEN